MTDDKIKSAYEEGKRAKQVGLRFADCPYQFHRHEGTQSEFDAEVRPLLNAWFNGWYGKPVHGIGGEA